jgi:signal transduction histidine kinase
MNSAAVRLSTPPTRLPRRPIAASLADSVIVEFATAGDVRSAMISAVARLRRGGGAASVEWWGPTEDGSALRLEASDGVARGRREAFPIGPVGAIVVTGADRASELTLAVTRLVPLLRRRWTEEQLAARATRLARQHEALEDFAALVAHELKTPLLLALHLDDSSIGLERALDVVDSLLEAARAESAADVTVSAADCLREALRDLGPISADVIADLARGFPLPSAALRVVLRNLIANAAAAGAVHIRVSALSSVTCWTLLVDDDGDGMDAADRYAAGSGLGLALCRRLVARFGGSLELKSRAVGGTRATLVIGGTDAK